MVKKYEYICWESIKTIKSCHIDQIKKIRIEISTRNWWEELDCTFS